MRVHRDHQLTTLSLYGARTGGDVIAAGCRFLGDRQMAITNVDGGCAGHRIGVAGDAIRD
jgi:hypothetical protein